MNQKTAQIIFIIFNILALFAVGYAVNDLLFVLSSIKEQSNVIPFDTGTYYLLLMTVFWVLSIIQYFGIRNKQSKMLKHGGLVVIGWFVFTLLLANAFPYYLTNKLEKAGYERRDDPNEISRVSRGASYLYVRENHQ